MNSRRKKGTGVTVYFVSTLLLFSCARGEDRHTIDVSEDPGFDSDIDVPHDPWPNDGDAANDFDGVETDGEGMDLAVDTWDDDEPGEEVAEDPAGDLAVDMGEEEPAADTTVDPFEDDGGGDGILASWRFDTCPEGWTAASLGHPELPSVSWECGIPTTGPGSDHSGGGNLFATRLHANYYFFEWSALTSPPVDLSGVAGSVTLTFWHWYKFEWCTGYCGAENPSPDALDGGNVEVWDGSSWVLVTPVGGYPGTLAFFDIYYTHPMKDDPGYNAEGTESTWVRETFDVTPYINADFRVRFVFGTDSGVSDYGWYVDDIALTAP